MGDPGSPRAPCAVCGTVTVLCCSGCESVFYCSPEHQQQDWRQHRRECRLNKGGTSPRVFDVSATSPRVFDASANAGGRSSPKSPRQHIRFEDVGDVGEESPRSPVLDVVPNYMRTELVTNNQLLEQPPEAEWQLQKRRSVLRTYAVQAAREGRHKEALAFAAEAYEVSRQIKRGTPGASEMLKELDSSSLVEVLLICRSAAIEGNVTVGQHLLSELLPIVDRLCGATGVSAVFEPCAATTLLMTVSELCFLYNHYKSAEDYANMSIAMARVAHGEGSPAVGDAHAFTCGLMTRMNRFEDALQHASMLLAVRQRYAGQFPGPSSERQLADAHWNVAVVKYQLKQYHSCLENLDSARNYYEQQDTDAVRTADVDAALGTVHSILGNYKAAVISFRHAIRARQRHLGFAHLATRSLAAQLDACVLKMKTEMEGGSLAAVAVVSPRGGNVTSTAISKEMRF